VVPHGTRSHSLFPGVFAVTAHASINRLIDSTVSCGLLCRDLHVLTISLLNNARWRLVQKHTTSDSTRTNEDFTSATIGFYTCCAATVIFSHRRASLRNNHNLYPPGRTSHLEGLIVDGATNMLDVARVFHAIV
jgi:hypothetical protein